jgi:hypothetical protein
LPNVVRVSVKIMRACPNFQVSNLGIAMFVFDAHDQSVEMSGDGNDRLVEVKLYPASEGCL